MEITIRAATADDAPAIAEVHVASWKGAYAGMLDLASVPEQLDVRERERMWAERIPLIGDEGHRTWVADIDGKVAGFAFTRPTEDEDLNPLEIAELEALYLAPDVFGAGIGKELLDRAVAGMRNQGFLQATLWVLEENVRAIHFYRREGWRPDGSRSACFRVMNAPALRYRFPL
jgi:ribosomal protein S18 acetylase RimI-like enzyme